MADVSITASDVLVADGVLLEIVECGEAVTAGQILVYDAADGDWVLASNASSLLSGSGSSNNLRLALADGAAGQRIAAARPGTLVTVGNVLSIARVYVLSTGGSFSPESDATTGDFTTIIGHAFSATQLSFNPVSTNVQVA